jgi:GTP-binding protein HflX
MCRLSRETGRQIGLLINRRGEIEHVVFGDASRLWLPDVGRLRASPGRLRGLRLVHTHLSDEGLSADDLTDLALLRLDLVMAIVTTREGQPGRAHCAHLAPGGGSAEDEPWTVLPAVALHRFVLDPLELTRALEARLRALVTGA